MSERVRVAVEDGRAVAIKVAITDVEADRLAAEAEWLRAARHPGVVELIGFDRPGRERAAELRTAFAGRPLAVAGPLTVAHAAGVTASVAATVADLHDLGVVHTRLGPSHVLIAGAGQPRLCGFSAASAPSDTATRADDVAAIGRLIHELVDDERSIAIPERRFRALGVRRRDHDRHALLAVADRAIDEPASRRPSARALSEAILGAVPRAVLRSPAADGPPDARPSEPRHRATRSGPMRGVLLVCAVAIVAVALAMRERGDRALEPLAAADAGTTTVVAMTPQPSATIATTSTVATRACPPTAPTDGPDVSGDGCPDRVLIEPPLVEVGTTRYAVGVAGDLVAVGDWDCDRLATPAVVRPSTGEVFVFDTWAERGAQLEVAPLTVVPGASAVAVAVAQPCDVLEIDAHGSTVRIDAEVTSR
jgi:hypothetical protein